MKKKILYYSLILGFGIISNSVNAQTVISFETSEGYSVGDINNQNGWFVTSTDEDEFAANQEITSSLASHGTQSLKIDIDESISELMFPVLGGFYDFPDVLTTTHYSIEADFYISESSPFSSNFQFFLAGEEKYITRFEFNFDQQLRTVEPSEESLVWSFIPNITWTPATWHKVKFEINGSSIKYYFDNNLVRTSVTSSEEPLQTLAFVHDNYSGYAHIDNIIRTDLTSASNHKPEQFNFSLYPNPTTGDLSIALEDNKGIEKISINDLNGRILKTFELNNINQTTIDLSDIASGIYMINISSEGSTISRKVIKK